MDKIILVILDHNTSFHKMKHWKKKGDWDVSWPQGSGASQHPGAVQQAMDILCVSLATWKVCAESCAQLPLGKLADGATMPLIHFVISL